jgi:multidrug resistance efflux pump
LKNSSLRIDLELTQLEIRCAELEKELENVKAAIDRHKSNLAQMPDAIKQKKQEHWRRLEKVGSSIVALKISLDQPKKTSNKSQKSTLFSSKY